MMKMKWKEWIRKIMYNFWGEETESGFGFIAATVICMKRVLNFELNNMKEHNRDGSSITFERRYC